MKRNKVLFWLIAAVILLCTACENDKKEEEISSTEVLEEANAQVEAVTVQDTLSESGMEEEVDLANTPVLLADPSFAYFIADQEKVQETSALTIRKETSSANAITDDDKWLLKNQISLPVYDLQRETDNNVTDLPAEIADTCGDLKITSAFYDKDYIYCTYGADYSEGYILKIYDVNTKEILYSLDFSAYRYSPTYVEEYYDFIEQRITWAMIKDHILYVSTSHNTYAESSNNQNAYLTAIDLTDNSIVWRSEALVDNAYDFQMIGDVIVCGYGFTAEPDYLYQISRLSGKVLDRISLKSAPSYIIQKDDVLFVRTYNTDYIFSIN